YRGHWKLLTFFLACGRGAGAVDVVGVVNSRSGCETLPGACESTNATAAPAITKATATARSPRHSQRRETGGMGGNRRRTSSPTRRGARHHLSTMADPMANTLLARFSDLAAARPLLSRVGDAEGVYLVGGAVRD